MKFSSLKLILITNFLFNIFCLNALNYPQTPPSDPDYILEVTSTAKKRKKVGKAVISKRTVKAWPSLWEIHGFDFEFLKNLAAACNSKDETLLHIAMRTKFSEFKNGFDGKMSLIQNLINGGADLYAKDNSGQTPLHSWACCKNVSHNEAEEVRKILKNKIKQDGVFDWEKLKDDETGSIPMHIACCKGLVNANLVATFISLGCPYEIQNNFGRTILHNLALAGISEKRASVLKYLLNTLKVLWQFLELEEHKKNFKKFLNQEDKFGNTAKDIAKNNNDQKMIEFLMNIKLLEN